jgi:serralysin
VSDGTNSGTQNITVNLTDVNESPYIVTTSFTVEEDQTFAGNVNATDPEGEALTYTVAGSEFVIVDSNLSFAGDASSVDYETKSTYTATVTVSDGVNSRTQNITVNLTDVNESPYIVTTSFTVPEGQTFVGNVNATDPEGEALTYTVAGSEFVIEDSNLSFVTAADYETKSTYTATVTVSDGVNSKTQDITVTVTDVTDEDGTGTGTGTSTSTGTGTGTGTSTSTGTGTGTSTSTSTGTGTSTST